jgi:hypothetical protein
MYVIMTHIGPLKLLKFYVKKVDYGLPQCLYADPEWKQYKAQNFDMVT